MLRDYVPVSDEDWPLIPAWLLGVLRSDAACMMLALIGAAGTGKSTRLEMLASVIHPCAAEQPKEFALPGLPKSLDDLLVTAFGTWIVGIDNVTEVSQPLSDLLCCLITGTKRNTRTLYSDSDLTILTVRRPVALASTAHVINAGDLADRCLVVDVPALDRRLPDHDLWAAFLKDRPKILGAVLDAFALALKNLDSVDLGSRSPRMSDFGKLVEAGETAFGFAPGTTVAAITSRQARISEDAILSSPFAQALRDIAKDGFEGSASELGERLGQSEHWSSQPRKLRTQLNAVIPDLRKVGITVSDRVKDGYTLWTLKKAA